MMRYMKGKTKITVFTAAAVFFSIFSSVYAQSSLQSLQAATRELAKKSLPSVVTVMVQSTIKVSGSQGFGRFFFFNPFESDPENNGRGGNVPKKYEQSGVGSGVIVRKTGSVYYVLTNAHVVDKADTIELITYSNDRIKAVVVGQDTARDIAVLSFESSKNLQAAKLGNSDDIVPGDLVFAIGSPHGFEFSLTFGIISAVKRSPPPGNGTIRGNLTEYIQTDAAVNQGNSGGPLLNINGEVIGINTWIYSQTGESAGLSFAVPINSIVQSIDTVIDTGGVTYGWLGVQHSTVLQDRMDSLMGSSDEGAFIAQVYRDSPAEKGGILPGDIIISINNKKIIHTNDLLSSIAGTKPGSRIKASVVRNGTQQTLNIVLGKRNDEAAVEKHQIQAWPGFTAVDLTQYIRDRFNISRKNGVMVTEVISDSAAAAAGLNTFDIIEKVNDKPVRNLREFYNAINTEKSGQLLFRVNRKGAIFIVGIVKS